MEQVSKELKQKLELQHYKIVGSHSAAKICAWTKKSMKDEDFCYKEKFYGIRSHLCCQITPNVSCTNKCIFCWRDLSTPTGKEWKWHVDDPKEIIEGCILAQRSLLSGFGGYKLLNKKKFKEAMDPMHFAISLIGEPTAYPRINELITELHKKNKTTFLVTNGMFPEAIKNLEMPTQLYVSVDAPNKALFKKIDKSMFKDGWQRLMKTLQVLPTLKTRTTLRFTIIKDYNMVHPEQWAEIIKISKPMFVEVKAYMYVGSSRKRLLIENMPLHSEIRSFAEQVAVHSGYKVIDEKKESRVVLLMEKDGKDRVMKF